MAKHIKTRKGDRIEIGRGITLLVTRSRGGELCVLVTAPSADKIQHIKASPDPHDVPENTIDTPFGMLPSQIHR